MPKKNTSLQKFRKRVADSKPKKPLTLGDFQIVAYVPWEQIKKKLGQKEFNRFLKFMEGQTCYEMGVFPDDLHRFLTGKSIVD